MGVTNDGPAVRLAGGRRRFELSSGTSRSTSTYNDGVTSVLKLDPSASSEEDELEFELKYQRALTTAQRFEMMFSRSREIWERLIRLGHRRAAEVVKRS